MVKKRWYDHDPTLSMAVSLLQNSEPADQVKTVTYAMTILEKKGFVEKHKLDEPLTLGYLFPFFRRTHMEQSSWRLLELLKQLPKDTQVSIALDIIQYIYKLDSGVDLGVSATDVLVSSTTFPRPFRYLL